MGKGKCGLQKYKGDGNCDDENNNCGCEFDGGDCCAKSVKGGKVQTAYCKQCQCKDPKHKVKGCNATCKSPKYIGDGNCDDDNNNCACGFDKGDCCGKMSKKPTARSANARTRTTRKIKTVKANAVSRSTRATATATTRTTTVAANSMEATAVRVLLRAERSKHLTANSASARIPSTLSKAAKPNARFQITLAMATATTRTTTVPADSIKATAAVKMSKKPTARSANARPRNTRSNWIRSF